MENKELLQAGERLDELHRNGYCLIQDPRRFCFGMDAVLLSGFATVKEGETVLDLGCGNGVIPILLAGKTKGTHFTGLEIQEESVSLARRSVLLNGLIDKITIDEGDIKDAVSLYKPSSFDVVTANPPYMKEGSGLINSENAKMIARHEVLCTLQDVVCSAAGVLKPGGRYFMIHRPQRLCEILAALQAAALEPKRLQFVHGTIKKEPSMLLIEAVKGGKPMVRVLPPLIVYQANGEYTQEVYDIYYGE